MWQMVTRAQTSSFICIMHLVRVIGIMHQWSIASTCYIACYNARETLLSMLYIIIIIII